MSSVTGSPFWIDLPEGQQQSLLRPRLGKSRVGAVSSAGSSLIELATAYYLVERGTAVQVSVDPERLGVLEGSWWGGVCPNLCGLKRSEGWQSLAIASRDLWPKLTVRPGFDFEWKVAGAWGVSLDADSDPQQQMLAGLEAGLSVQAVDQEQFALTEPALRVPDEGGLQSPSEGQLNPLAVVACFVRQLAARGVLIADSAAGTNTANTPAGTASSGSSAAGWNQLRVLEPAPSQAEVASQFDSGWQAVCLWSDAQAPMLSRLVCVDSNQTGSDQYWQQLRNGRLLLVTQMPNSTLQQTNLGDWWQAAVQSRLHTESAIQLAGSHTRSIASPQLTEPRLQLDRNRSLLTVVVDPRDQVLLAAGLGQALADWQRTGNCPELLRPFLTETSTAD